MHPHMKAVITADGPSSNGPFTGMPGERGLRFMPVAKPGATHRRPAGPVWGDGPQRQREEVLPGHRPARQRRDADGAHAVRPPRAGDRERGLQDGEGKGRIRLRSRLRAWKEPSAGPHGDVPHAGLPHRRDPLPWPRTGPGRRWRAGSGVSTAGTGCGSFRGPSSSPTGPPSTFRWRESPKGRTTSARSAPDPDPTAFPTTPTDTPVPHTAPLRKRTRRPAFGHARTEPAKTRGYPAGLPIDGKMTRRESLVRA